MSTAAPQTYCHSCAGPRSEQSQGHIHICISHSQHRHIGARIHPYSPHMGQWLQTEKNGLKRIQLIEYRVEKSTFSFIYFTCSLTAETVLLPFQQCQ